MWTSFISSVSADSRRGEWRDSTSLAHARAPIAYDFKYRFDNRMIVVEPKNVLFSIVCPTFNRSKLLGRAIDSVLRQQLGDFELIIVNDGSTDDTRDLVSRYNDKRIVYIEHEKNKGTMAACNTGFDKAKGTYIAKLDDDDELSNHALQVAFDAFNELPNDRIKVLFFNCIDVETGLISGKSLPEEATIRYEDLLCQKLMGDYWVVVERSILSGGETLDERSWDDFGSLWLRLLRNFDGYYVPKICLLCYREHGLPRRSNSDTNSRNLQAHEYTAKVLLEEFGVDMKSYCPKVYSKQIAALAFYRLLNKNSRKARSDLLLSLKNHFTVFALVLLLLSFTGNEKSALFIYERVLRNSVRIFF